MILYTPIVPQFCYISFCFFLTIEIQSATILAIHAMEIKHLLIEQDFLRFAHILARSNFTNPNIAAFQRAWQTFPLL